MSPAIRSGFGSGRYLHVAVSGNGGSTCNTPWDGLSLWSLRRFSNRPLSQGVRLHSTSLMRGHRRPLDTGDDCRVIGGTAPRPRSQARDSSLPADTGEAPIHYTITRRRTTSRRWAPTSACLTGLAQGMVFTSLVELLVAEHRRDTWPRR
jgi:hypothetical protein